MIERNVIKMRKVYVFAREVTERSVGNHYKNVTQVQIFEGSALKSEKVLELINKNKRVKYKLFKDYTLTGKSVADALESRYYLSKFFLNYMKNYHSDIFENGVERLASLSASDVLDVVTL